MLMLPTLLPIALLIASSVIINNVLRYLLHRRIIDSGLIDERIVKTVLKPVGFKEDALKWGLLFLFGGIGLVILEFIPYRADQSPLPYGIEAIALSIGFLVYFLIAQRTDKNT